MDPVSQIFLQAQAPTGKSNTGFEAFVQGRQLAQRDRQLNMQQREQDALLQLRAQAEALQNMSTGLDVDLKMLQKEREIQVKANEGRVVRLMLKAGELGWTHPAIREELFDIADKVPGFLSTPNGKAAVSSWMLAKESNRQHQAFKMATEGMTPGKVTFKDPVTGVTQTFESTKANSVENARALIAVHNLQERMKGGQLDEKKFQLEMLKMVQEIENDFTLRNKPEIRQQKIESLQNAFKTLGLGSNTVNLPPELQRFLNQGLITAPAPPIASPQGEFRSTDSPPATGKRTPSSTPRKYRFQNGRIVPIE